MLASGKLRTRLSIQRRAINQDASGEQSTSWNEIAITSGMIEGLSGRELLMAQAVRADTTHRVTIRYYPGLLTNDRLVYTSPEGRLFYYNITHVVDVEMRHRVLECTVAEGLATG